MNDGRTPKRVVKKHKKEKSQIINYSPTKHASTRQQRKKTRKKELSPASVVTNIRHKTPIVSNHHSSVHGSSKQNHSINYSNYLKKRRSTPKYSDRDRFTKLEKRMDLMMKKMDGLLSQNKSLKKEVKILHQEKDIQHKVHFISLFIALTV